MGLSAFLKIEMSPSALGMKSDVCKLSAVSPTSVRILSPEDAMPSIGCH